jgi:hypothetical protein
LSNAFWNAVTVDGTLRQDKRFHFNLASASMPGVRALFSGQPNPNKFNFKRLSSYDSPYTHPKLQLQSVFQTTKSNPEPATIYLQRHSANVSLGATVRTPQYGHHHQTHLQL